MTLKLKATSEKQFLAAHRRLPRSDLLLLAFHEAGHAVAARLLGVAVEHASVTPTWGGKYNPDSYGHVAFVPGGKRCLLDDTTIAVAADVAVSLHLGLPDDQHGDLLGEVGAAIYGQALKRARELLETPDARDEVRRVAAGLLKNKTLLQWEETSGPTTTSQGTGKDARRV